MIDFEGAVINRRGNVRSPSKIGDHVGVMIHRNSSGAIVTIIRANGGKAVLRSVGKIFIFDTYVDSSVLSFKSEIDTASCSAVRKQNSHPSMPPLPVARNRSLHFSGSHSSNDRLDLFDVGIESPIRQILTATT